MGNVRPRARAWNGAPRAKSLERNDEACRKIEDLLNKTPRVQYTTSVVGFTLLSRAQTPTAGFSSSPQAHGSQRTTPDSPDPGPLLPTATRRLLSQKGPGRDRLLR